MTITRRPPKTVTVELAGFTGKRVVLNANATEGATVGVDLFAPDGSLVNWSDILNPATSTPASASAETTDELPEGLTNLYFTKPRVATALAPGAGITLSTDGSGVTTIADTASVLENLSDQLGVLLTDQLGVELTSNTIPGAYLNHAQVMARIALGF